MGVIWHSDRSIKQHHIYLYRYTIKRQPVKIILPNNPLRYTPYSKLFGLASLSENAHKYTLGVTPFLTWGTRYGFYLIQYKCSPLQVHTILNGLCGGILMGWFVLYYMLHLFFLNTGWTINYSPLSCCGHPNSSILKHAPVAGLVTLIAILLLVMLFGSSLKHSVFIDKWAGPFGLLYLRLYRGVLQCQVTILHFVYTTVMLPYIAVAKQMKLL